VSLILKNWSKVPYAFGGAALSAEGGGYGFGAGEDKPEDILAYAFDRGVALFDTAPIYGFGHSEEVLAPFIKNKREKLRVITKSGVTWNSSKRVDMTNDPKVLTEMLENSLRRLNTDYIDLYMIHWPDSKVDIRKPLEELMKHKEKDKVLEIGLCNTYVEDLKKAEEICNIRVVQSQMNIFEQPSEDIQEYLTEKNISFMGWGAFDKGILTGRVTKEREQSKDYDKNDCRKSAPWWNQADVLRKVEVAKKLKSWGEGRELSLKEVALGFISSHPFASQILMGAKSVKDWRDVLDLKLPTFSQEELAEIQEICHSSPS